ncbi:MAG: fimbrillin family protein [Bacteroidaceae bacterium]
MKNRSSFFRLSSWLLGGCLCCLSACRHESAPLAEPGAIEVSLSAASHIQTRVTDNRFEASDAVGLYLLQQPQTLDATRWADNVRFVFDGAGWQADAPLYYPPTTDPCDFYAYYPYRADALPAASSALACEVAADQRTPSAWQQSDLLVAEKFGVTPSPDPVPLVFKHRLTEVCVELLPGTGFASVEELAASQPEVRVKNTCLKGRYDLAAKTVTDLNASADIVPAGQWTVSGDRLVGKRAIVLPQTVAGDVPFVEVTAEGRTYAFFFGERHVLASATRQTCTLTLKKAATQGGIAGEVADWENDEALEGDLVETETDEPDPASGNYVFAVPDFADSEVYQAMVGGKVVAEICREYLRADGVNARAVVAYPVADGATDLTQGFVLQLLDADGQPAAGAVHGGKVAWDVDANVLNYTAGTENARTKIHYSRLLGLTSETLKGANPVDPTPYRLDDGRNGTSYPIVKVATQYWMGSNLKAEACVDGTSLLRADSDTDWTKAVSDKTPAYCVKDGNYYYTYAAATATGIAPDGWALPTLGEWMALGTYVNNEGALLTAWEGSSNLTGMSIGLTRQRNTDGTFTTGTAAYFWNTTCGIAVYTKVISDRYLNTGNSIRFIRAK